MQVERHSTRSAEIHLRLAWSAERAADGESPGGGCGGRERRKRHRPAGLVEEACGTREAAAPVCRAVERGRNGRIRHEDRDRQRRARYAPRGIAVAAVDAERREVAVEVKRQQPAESALADEHGHTSVLASVEYARHLDLSRRGHAEENRDDESR